MTEREREIQREGKRDTERETHTQKKGWVGVETEREG